MDAQPRFAGSGSPRWRAVTGVSSLILMLAMVAGAVRAGTPALVAALGSYVGVLVGLVGVSREMDEAGEATGAAQVASVTAGCGLLLLLAVIGLSAILYMGFAHCGSAGGC